LERLPGIERTSGGIHSQQPARLLEIVEFIQSQVGLYSTGFSLIYLFMASSTTSHLILSISSMKYQF